MLKAYLLRFHRWVALVFALPLLLAAGTGLILSFEPIVQVAAVKPGSVSGEKLIAAIEKFDPAGKARGISIDPRLNVLTIQGVGADGSTDVDLASGEETDAESALDDVFSQARRLHQRFIFGLRWLVTASSFAMLALAGLGLFMGFSRLRNSVSGWHKGVAWVLLPLVVLSPLTGAMLAFNVDFAGAGGAGQARGGARPERASLIDAARVTVANADAGTILSIGNRGGKMLARVVANGEARGFVVTKDGLAATPRNWSRSLHVGDGLWTGVLNVLASLAILLLLGTGVIIWGRRELRLRAIRRNKRALGAQAPA